MKPIERTHGTIPADNEFGDTQSVAEWINGCGTLNANPHRDRVVIRDSTTDDLAGIIHIHNNKYEYEQYTEHVDLEYLELGW